MVQQQASQGDGGRPELQSTKIQQTKKRSARTSNNIIFLRKTKDFLNLMKLEQDQNNLNKFTKKASQKPIIINKSHDVTKGRGRFGPYLKWNNTFINVNNKYDFDNLTEQDCIELIEEKIKKTKKKFL